MSSKLFKLFRFNPCAGIPGGIPDAPYDFAVTGGWAAIFLAWIDPTGVDLRDIHIYRSVDHSSGFTHIATVPIGVENYADTAAAPGIVYYYKIRAGSTSNSLSPFSETQSGMREEVPPEEQSWLLTGFDDVLSSGPDDWVVWEIT